jgi:hypothetical protein
MQEEALLLTSMRYRLLHEKGATSVSAGRDSKLKHPAYTPEVDEALMRTGSDPVTITSTQERASLSFLAFGLIAASAVRRTRSKLV